jgi:hypothetical protein
MTGPANHPMPANNQGVKSMEFLIPLGVLVVWFILQAWVLPRLGVKT